MSWRHLRRWMRRIVYRTSSSGAVEILRLIRRMMETGKADDSMDDMIEAVAAINAGRLSVRDGGRSVSLQEVDPQ